MKQQREAINTAQSLLSHLKCCRDLQWGRRLHAEAVKSQNHTNVYVVSALIRMYAKCGSMVDARHLFDSMQEPDVVSWTALLLGYAENGEGQRALDLFSRMKAGGLAPDCVTYVAALKACSSLAVNGSGARDSLRQGREIHSEIGRHLNRYVQNTLIDMYAKCRSMVEARRVFDSMQRPNVVSWNALLQGYAENGEGTVALELFSTMKARGFAPDSVTYVAALKACTSVAMMNEDVSGKRESLQRGREIHSEIGSHFRYAATALIRMYIKCGSMVDARLVFDSIESPDVVSLTAMLLGYAENGEGRTALDLFRGVKGRGCVPNSATYVAALKACTSLVSVNGDGSGRVDCLKHGREIHSEIGCHLNLYVQNTLVDMYAKCGRMDEARRVFDSISDPDVISWNALLLGYAENKDGSSALEFFSKMKAQGSVPDPVTYMAALKACCLTGDLALGRKLHSEIPEFTPRLVTCLVDFYARCGSMAEAREVFDSHSRERGLSTWNALLAGYSSFGDSASVFRLFEAMQDEGLQPNAITFACLLLCCSHAGLVEKAWEYLEAMPLRYGVAPSVVHYNCMVDLLGRANRLNEAAGVLRRMPCNPDASTWRALLCACRKWKNIEIGRIAFQSLVGMNNDDASAHVLTAHMYGSRENRGNPKFREEP